ncbi:MAG: hypothetical protein K8R13_01610 [Methanococcoides sp.]|nr:hypothetical protein [Methanococcoides sp.]
MTYIENTEGFKFAVIAMTAVVAALIKVYEIIQNTAVELMTYIFLNFLITFLSFVFILFFFYIIIKGLSMESLNIGHKENLNKLASEIYKLTFILITLMIVLTILTILRYTFNYTNIISNILFLFSLLVTYTIYLYIDRNNKFQRALLCINYIKHSKIRKSIKNFNTKYPKWFRIMVSIAPSPNDAVKILYSFLIFWFCLGFLFILYFLPYVLLMGNVNIEMENQYYKNETFIPVSIKETGLITDQTIELSQAVDLDYDLNQIDKITLKTKNNLNKIESGKNSTLIGVALGHGNYNVFINTSNLTNGFYVLAVSGYKECIKGFYIS